ncbi:MAG: ferredoxin [Candidatus Daviesbacteria bacterium]|nr:ferredoxin [Candidatus Daviesbacteria bacterium]
MKDTTKKEIKVQIDRSLCSSCGMCVTTTPEFFELDGDLISRVKNNPTFRDLPILEEAAQNCPSEAIKITKL